MDHETPPLPPAAATSGRECRPRRRASTPKRPRPTPISFAAPPHRARPSSSEPSSRRRRRPRPERAARRSAGVLAATIAVGCGARAAHAAAPPAFAPSSRAAADDGGEGRSSPAVVAVDLPPAPDGRATHGRRALVDEGGCAPDQHRILLTLYTDAHSIFDNSWELSHASFGYGLERGNSGADVDAQRVLDGKLGYGAVLTHAVCADRSTAAPGEGGPAMESCYDLELRDRNGDGLTAPHSKQGGLAGGFKLEVDGTVVAEHRGRACLSENEREWNECAVDGGFEYCGLRVCVTSDGGEGGAATLSNLSGSQCSLAQPQCDAGSAARSSSSSVAVTLDTDSYSQELSWEVRKSSKRDSVKIRHAARNDLLLAGGMPVRHDDTDAVLLGRDGAGVPLADNESFESVACLPDAIAGARGSCFDLRAYDAYGDGMGCGADGSLSLSVRTPGRGDDGEPVLRRMTLTQKDEDMAKRQRVDGNQRLACMNKKKLAKWSYCAVRVCADGDVIGLEGNQCDFGLGKDLIDWRYDGRDPLMGQKMKPYGGNEWPSIKEEDEEHAVIVPTEEVQLNIITAFNADGNENDDETWAEYYANLEPGLRDEVSSPADTIAAAIANQQNEPLQMYKPLQMGTAIDESDDEKPKKKQQGQKGPKRSRSKKKKQGQKGPRQDKDKKGNLVNTRPRPDMIPTKKEDIQPFNEQVANQRRESVKLKPFTINILDVEFPHDLEDSRPSQLSNSVADYLLSYFNDYTKKKDYIPAPADLKLDCTRFKKKVLGSEVQWVMVCEGDAEFRLPPSTSPPPRKNLSRVIREAFDGKAMEKFLEAIYDYGKEDKKKEDKKKEDKKKEDKKVKEKKRLQGGGGGGSSSSERSQKQNKNKMEKKEAKKQMKLDKKEDKKQRLPRAYDIINRDVHIDVYGENNRGLLGAEAVGREGKNDNRQRRRQRRSSGVRGGEDGTNAI